MISNKGLSKSLLFLLAAALHFFSITALLIITGLTGSGELVANIAIAQGAILLVFLSLLGNARNFGPAIDTEGAEKKLFYLSVGGQRVL